jgi:hypothetical protein
VGFEDVEIMYQPTSVLVDFRIFEPKRKMNGILGKIA